MEDLRVAKAFLAKVSVYGRQRALEHQAVSENASETVQAAAAPAFDSPSTMRTVRLQVSTCHGQSAVVQFTLPCLLMLGPDGKQCWTTWLWTPCRSLFLR